MGVKTYYWGPQAWVYIHTSAKVLDQVNNHEMSAMFWFSIPSILPCVFCRKSAKNFISDLYLKTTSNRRMAYCLHQEVNLKLFKQELIATYEDDVELGKVMKKWSGYQPTFNQVKYENENTSSFVNSLTTFLYYVVCDVDVPRLNQIMNLFSLIGEVYKDTHFGRQWKQSLNDNRNMKITPLSALCYRIN